MTLLSPDNSLGNHLEGKTTAVPLRKPHGAAVFPLHDILVVGLNGDPEEKDVQMDVFVYVASYVCLSILMMIKLCMCILF